MNHTKEEILEAIKRAGEAGNKSAVAELTAYLERAGVESAPAPQPYVSPEATAETQLNAARGMGGRMFLPSGVDTRMLNQSSDFIAGMGVRGGSQAVGAAIGAIPPLVAITGGASIPTGSAVGSFVGELLEGRRTGVRPTTGELAGATIGGMFIPGGASAARGVARPLLNEMGFSGAGNLAAAATQSVLDRNGVLPVDKQLVAVGSGLLSPVIGRAVSRASGVDARSASEIGAAKRDATRIETFTEAMDAGYKLDPALANASFLNKGLVRIAGQSKLQQELSIKNQEVTNAVIRRELGIGQNASLSQLEMDAAKIKLEAPYNEIANINPKASKLLEEWKSARSEVRSAWNLYRGSNADPKLRAAAANLEVKADVIHDKIHDIAKRTNNAGLFEEFEQASVKLAKWHAVDSSINYANGNVDALIIGAMFGTSPKRLTGGLLTVGKFAEAMKPVMRETADVTGNSSGTIRAGLAITAAEIGRRAGGAVGAAVGAGTVLMGDTPLRHGLSSKLFQEEMALPFYLRQKPTGVERFLRYSTAAGGRDARDDRP